jgi:hypothetical protein
MEFGCWPAGQYEQLPEVDAFEYLPLGQETQLLLTGNEGTVPSGHVKH